VVARHRTALVVNASPHGQSVTTKFCKIFEKGFGAEYTNQLNLHDAPPRFSDGSYATDTPLQKQVLDVDVLFIATPTYWFNVPAILKAFIDELSGIDTKKLWAVDRYVVVAVHAPQGGEIGAVGALVLPLNMMGFTLPANGFVYYRNEDDSWAWNDLTEIAKQLRYDE
jgi:NAD(P)H-dependent FMN reductase